MVSRKLVDGWKTSRMKGDLQRKLSLPALLPQTDLSINLARPTHNARHGTQSTIYDECCHSKFTGAAGAQDC
jgi:hypothetical protein